MPPSRRNALGKSKIETFIGFSVKSRKIAYGCGAIDALKNEVYLIIVSADAAANTQKLAVKFKNRHKCPLLICKTDFERIVNRAGCKIVAVRDRGLARAITENTDNDYEIYAGGTD